MKKRKIAADALVLGIILVLGISCASAPEASFQGAEAEGRELLLLPADGKVYIWADTVKARPILDVVSFEGLSGKDAAQMLDRTVSAGGVILNEGQGRRFFLAASGNYPRTGASFSLAFSKAWKKLKSPSGKSYWFSRSNNIALALGSGLALVSDADPWEVFVPNPPGGEPLDQAFMDFLPGLVLALWMPDSSDTVNGFVDSLGLPLQIPSEELFFGIARKPKTDGLADPDAVLADASEPALPDAEIWELIFRIKTPSVSHARSLQTLFSVARFFIQPGALPHTEGSEDPSALSPQEVAAMLFANAPSQDGEYFTIRTASLSANRIALLFAMFSVYSDTKQ